MDVVQTSILNRDPHKRLHTKTFSFGTTWSRFVRSSCSAVGRTRCGLATAVVLVPFTEVDPLSSVAASAPGEMTSRSSTARSGIATGARQLGTRQGQG